MRKFWALAACLACALALSCCGEASVPDEVSTPSLVISKEGTVTAYQVGIFDKEYYDIREFEAMAVKVVANYNTSHPLAEGVGVEVKDVYLVAGEYPKAVIAYSFGDCGNYEDFFRFLKTDSTLFYGTVADARKAGYDPDHAGTLYTVPKSGGERVKMLETPEFGPNDKVIITSEQAVLYCPSRIKYMTDGVTLLAQDVADATLNSGYAYIFLK